MAEAEGGRSKCAKSLWGLEIAEMLRQLPRAAGDPLSPPDPALAGSDSWPTL